MSVPDPDALQEFLAAQRADYRASLPVRLALLQAGWAAARADGGWRELERCAHGVAGSAATFGFAALGDAARELEDAVEGLAAAGAPLPAQALAGIEAQVAGLAHLLREAIAEAPAPPPRP